MSPEIAVWRDVGQDNIRSRGLFVEAGAELDLPDLQAMADLVITAHAPWILPEAEVAGTRLHIASTDEQFRQRSVRVIERYVERAHKLFGHIKLIVTHAAPHYFPDPPVRPQPGEPIPPLRSDLASWQLLVESLVGLARKCRRLGLELAVENNWAYWTGIEPDADVTALGPGDYFEYFCTSPQEWLSLPEQVGEPNLSLCLDPSHAGPYCHRVTELGRRREMLKQYIRRPELIGHIHWNDSDIEHPRGRQDLHLLVGTGTLGRDFNAALKARARQLDHPVTLEHFDDLEALDRELAYIASL